MDSLPVCGAKSKQSGVQCRNFAVKGKRVCYLHGGMSTGAKTIEGRQRARMAPWKHGRRSKEAIAERREVRELIRASRQMIASI